MDETREISIPEDEAIVAEVIAQKKGLTLEEYIALLLRKEVCDTQQEKAD